MPDPLQDDFAAVDQALAQGRGNKGLADDFAAVDAEIERRRMATVPALAQPVVAGLRGAGMSMGSTLARLTGGAEGSQVADAMNRETDAMGQGQDQAVRQAGVLNPWLARQVGGATNSLAQVIATPGGMASKLLGAAAVQGNQSATEGADAGLQGAGLLGYAGAMGALEAVPSLIINKLGGKTVEAQLTEPVRRWFQDGLISGMRGLGAEGAKVLRSELRDELATTLGQQLTKRLAGVDPNATSPEALREAVVDTVAQTVLMTGASHGIHSLPGLAVDSANAVAESIADQRERAKSERMARLAAILSGDPRMAQIQAIPGAPANVGQVIAQEQVRRGLPQDFTPSKAAVVPETGGALPEGQPMGLDQAMAEIAATAPRRDPPLPTVARDGDMAQSDIDALMQSLGVGVLPMPSGVPAAPAAAPHPPLGKDDVEELMRSLGVVPPAAAPTPEQPRAQVPAPQSRPVDPAADPVSAPAGTPAAPVAPAAAPARPPAAAAPVAESIPQFIARRMAEGADRSTQIKDVRRTFNVGYNTAAKAVDLAEQADAVGPSEGDVIHDEEVRAHQPDPVPAYDVKAARRLAAPAQPVPPAAAPGVPTVTPSSETPAAAAPPAHAQAAPTPAPAPAPTAPTAEPRGRGPVLPAPAEGNGAAAAEPSAAPAPVKPAAGTPGRARVRPGSVDTPAQGALASAKIAVGPAWKRVKDLRERVKEAGPQAGTLRVDLIKAESAHREALARVNAARDAIEKRAEQLGQTTRAAPPAEAVAPVEASQPEATPVVSDEQAAGTTQPAVGDRVRVMGAKPGRDVGTVSKITDRGMVEVTGDDGRIIGGEVVADRVEKVSGAEEPAPITDVGEKIGGARKDRIAVDDLAGMSSEERQAAVKRSAVWSEPDPQELMDGGMPVETAWMVMRAYGGIAKAPIIKSEEASDPAKRDAALRVYVESVGRLRDRLLAARSAADVTAALKAEWPELYQRGMISDYTGYYAARDRYAIVARSNQLANAAADQRAMRKDLAAGWPNKAAWQSRYRISESVFAERRGRWTVRARNEGLRREEYAREQAGELSQDFATKAEAEAEAERRYAAIKRDGGGKEPVRPLNPDARRSGAPRRDGDRDITADELRTAFGFRGVEFGNWSNQADRQQAINQAFDGLHDLAELMGVPPAAMSLDGRLGLAFGARGGGKFAAHYEPGKVVINLTRTRGAGTLAHEWAHAVDNYFGKAGAGGRIDAYGSNDAAMVEDAAGKAGVRPEVIEAWRAIRKAMAVGPDGKASNYRKESAAGGDYWSRPTEMFARAFEVWAAQRIADAGGASPYLVQGVPTGKVDMATVSEFARRYPLNEDAQRINAAIEAWVRILKTEETPQGTTRLFSEQDENARPVTVNLEAVNTALGKAGKVHQVPGGWRFVASNGRSISIRPATAAEAREHAVAGIFYDADPLTGEPGIVLVPGRADTYTVNHEVVHFAKWLGLLSEAQEKALARLGAKHGLAKDVVARYRAAGITDPKRLREELAAKTMEAIHAGKIKVKPTFVQKVMDLLRAMGRMFTGGTKSDRELAQEVASGEVWERSAPERSPAGGRPMLSLDSAPVASITGREFSGTVKERDAQATAWAKKNLAGRRFVNRATGWEVLITGNGIEHTMAKLRGADAFEVVRVLDRIIEDGALAASAPEAKGNRDVALVHRLMARVDMFGEIRTVKATVKEYHDGAKRFYEYQLLETEPPMPSTGSRPDDPAGQSSGTGGAGRAGDTSSLPPSDSDGKRLSLADDAERQTPQERLEQARQGVDPGQRPDTNPSMLDELRRHFVHLDPAKRAEAIAILRSLEAQLDAASGQAERIILGHVNGLNNDQAEAFNDRLVLDDILRQIEAGEFDGGTDSQGRTAQQIADAIKGDLADVIKRGGDPAAEAYARRRAFQAKHTKAMVDADLLEPDALNDPRYYHRQVLSHLTGEHAGKMGLGGDQVRQRMRGFQKGRSGGTAADIPFYGDQDARRDFNANYAQAEFEYLAQSIQELARHDALEQIRARYDALPAAKAEAKAKNRAAMDDLWAKEHTAPDGSQDEEAMEQGWDYPWRSRLAMNNDDLASAAADSDGKWGGPFDYLWQKLARERQEWDQKRRQGAADPWRFSHPDWWKGLAWLASQPGLEVQAERTTEKGRTVAYTARPAINALAIFKAIYEREQHMQETLGKDYRTWRQEAADMVRDADMQLWQPKEGLQLVPGWAAGDEAIAKALREAGIDDAALADALPDAAPVAGELRRALIVMGKKPEWLIPADLARQLDAMKRTPDLGAFMRRAEQATRTWKLLMLHQPLRVAKYQINNFFGDLDVALTQPGIMREVAKDRAQIARDLWAFTHGKPLSPAVEAQMRAAQEGGLLDSGVSAAELPDVNRLPALKALFGKGWDLRWDNIPGTIKEAVSRYFDGAQQFGRWREAILRVAALRTYYDQISPNRRRYAGSRKDELDQLYGRWAALNATLEAIARRKNPTDQEAADAAKARREASDLHATIAAKLAREVMGDYGNLSHAGQKARRLLIPFWSWMEINAPRYLRIIRNSRYEGAGGNAQAMGAAAALGGGLALRMAALTGGVMLWNAAMKAMLGVKDDEDPNKDADLSKLLIIMPWRDGDGSVWGIRVAGAMADALSWLDLDNVKGHAQELAKGYQEGRLAQAGMEVAKDVAKAPVNRLGQGLTPIAKVPIEQVAGRTFFPDLFKPRPLTDRWGHLADAGGVGGPYRAATDKAGAGDTVASLVLAHHDPRTAAGYRIRDMVNGWAARNGVALRSGGGVPTEQQVALRQARSSFARGEQDRAQRWMRRYLDAGGKVSNLGASKANMHPMAALKVADRTKFTDSLDANEKAALGRAVSQWREFWEQPNEGFMALARRVDAAKPAAKP